MMGPSASKIKFICKMMLDNCLCVKSSTYIDEWLHPVIYLIDNNLQYPTFMVKAGLQQPRLLS